MTKSDLTYYAHQSFNDCDKDMDDSLNMNYLQTLNSLTNNVFYIFDYTRDKLIYPDNLIQFLGDKFPLTNQGYQFYEKYVHPEDLKMLVKINNLAFDFFYALKQDQKKHVNIVYDIRLKGINGDYILGEFYQFNLSSCIRQQNSLTAQFVSFSLSNLANIFYPPQFLQ